MIPPAINRTIRAVLVDDEKGARMHLTERLAVHPGIMIIGEADRAQAAIDLIHRAKPDVIFLDVQMPGGTGFSLLPLLSDMCPPPEVVFVTAYDKYALKAFEANALDYLTKPVSPPRLAVTVARLQNLFLATGAAPKDEADASAPPRPAGNARPRSATRKNLPAHGRSRWNLRRGGRCRLHADLLGRWA